MAKILLSGSIKTVGDVVPFEMSEEQDGAIFGDIVVAAGATVDIAIAFVKAKIAFFFMVADQNVTVTFENGGTADSFVRPATKAFFWSSSLGLVNPFTSNVVSMTAHNTSDTETVLKIRGVEDISS